MVGDLKINVRFKIMVFVNVLSGVWDVFYNGEYSFVYVDSSSTRNTRFGIAFC